MNNIKIYVEVILGLLTIVGLIITLSKYILTLNKNIKEILEEVKPNGGKSLKDKVSAIQEQVNKDSNLINKIVYRQRWLLDNRPEPIFECDTIGNCTWVNEKYCQLLQHDVDYFLGNGWKNGVHSEDLENVEKEWNKAINDKRSSSSEYRVVDREGNIYKVKVVAVRNDDYGYIGSIQILEDFTKNNN